MMVSDSVSRFLSYLEMRIINPMFFLFHIFHSIKLFHSFLEVALQGFSKIFKKLPNKNSAVESILRCISYYKDIFLRILLKFLEHLIKKATVDNKVFDNFSSNFLLIHRSCLKLSNLLFDKKS